MDTFFINSYIAYMTYCYEKKSEMIKKLTFSKYNLYIYKIPTSQLVSTIDSRHQKK